MQQHDAGAVPGEAQVFSQQDQGEVPAPAQEVQGVQEFFHPEGVQVGHRLI
jgi:hypothetical protein